MNRGWFLEDLSQGEWDMMELLFYCPETKVRSWTMELRWPCLCWCARAREYDKLWPGKERSNYYEFTSRHQISVIIFDIVSWAKRQWAIPRIGFVVLGYFGQQIVACQIIRSGCFGRDRTKTGIEGNSVAKYLGSPVVVPSKETNKDIREESKIHRKSLVYSETAHFPSSVLIILLWLTKGH